MKVKREDGTEIEVFTQEELDAKVKAIEESKSSEIEKAKQEALEQYKNSDEYKALTDKIANAKTPEDLAKLKADLEAGFAAKIKEYDEKLGTIQNQNHNQQIDNSSAKYSRGGKTRAAKIKVEDQNYKPDATDPASLEERAQNAARIVATRDGNPNIMNNIANISGNDGGGEGNNKDGLNDNVKNIGKVLGVKPDDYEKYSPEKLEEYNRKLQGLN